jgi:hypothetical protein
MRNAAKIEWQPAELGRQRQKDAAYDLWVEACIWVVEGKLVMGVVETERKQ